MRIFGSYTLPFDREKAYFSLYDPFLLAQCVPGCDAFEKVGDDEYAISMKLTLDSFSGVYSGTIKISDAAPPERFRITVQGAGLVGSLKGEGLMSLTPKGASTSLNYDGDIQVGGAITALGQRVIDSTAKMMIRKFFEKFTEEVKAKT